MKKLLVIFVSVLLLTSCADGFQHSSEDDPASSSELESPAEQSPSIDDTLVEHTENSALTAIQGFDAMPEDALLGVRYYRRDVAWMEINQLLNLERYQPMEPEHNYFLIIPRYVGADVRVETMLFDESAGKWKAGEITYQKENISDGYALLINDVMPEGGPHKRVVITHRNESGSCDFTVDNYSGIHPPPWYKDRAYMIDPPTAEMVPTVADRIHPVETVDIIPDSDLPPERLSADTPRQYRLDAEYTLVFTESEGLACFALYYTDALKGWLAFPMDLHTHYSLLETEFQYALGAPQVSFDPDTQTATVKNEKLSYAIAFKHGKVSGQYHYTDELIPEVDQLDQQGNLFSDKVIFAASADGRYIIYGGDRFGMGDYGEVDLILKDQASGAMTFLCNADMSAQALFGKDNEILINQIDRLIKLDASGEVSDSSFAIDCEKKNCFLTGIAYDAIKDWYLVTWRSPKQPETDTCPVWLDVYSSDGTLVKSINSEVSANPWRVNWVPKYDLVLDGNGTVEIGNSASPNEQSAFPIRLYYW